MADLRTGAATLKGNPIDLLGPELKVGETAPPFTVQGADLGDLTLASTAGKTRVVFAVPSLDTSVCAIEAKKFNEEAAKSDDIEIICISMDLPFAMKRWCAAEGVEKVKVASDHRTALFGTSYGVLIAGGPLERVLHRAVFVIGPDDKLKYVEYLKEVAEEPNYAAVLEAAKS